MTVRSGVYRFHMILGRFGIFCAKPLRSHIPILLRTAAGSPASTASVIGAAACLAKPFGLLLTLADARIGIQ